MSAIPHGGEASHINGSATTSPATLPEKGSASTWLSVCNADATNNLLVSFDGGTNFTTIFPKTRLEGPFKVKSLTLKSSSSTVAYEILFVQ